MNEPIRVLLVDDHPVVREGLRAMLEMARDFQVVGEAATGEDAIDMVTHLSPHLVLMDLILPGIDGIEATRRIKLQYPAVTVIVLTGFDDKRFLIEAIRSGASGFLPKGTSQDLLRQTVKAAVDGETLIKSGYLREVLSGLPKINLGPSIEKLNRPRIEKNITPQELNILKLLVEGYTNKEIGSNLHISDETVKQHVKNIIGKLGASDRTQAAVTAVRLGIVT